MSLIMSSQIKVLFNHFVLACIMVYANNSDDSFIYSMTFTLLCCVSGVRLFPSVPGHTV